MSPAVGRTALGEDDDRDIAGPGELDGPSGRRSLSCIGRGSGQDGREKKIDRVDAEMARASEYDENRAIGGLEPEEV
jgi:hypothetical protein